MIRRRPTPHQTPGRAGAQVRLVVLHTTAGRGEGTIDWFSRPESGVSAHYLVGLDGSLVQFVDEADTARHAGRLLDPSVEIAPGEDPNEISIGIEFEDGGEPWAPRPAAQYDAGAALLARIAQRWRLPLDRRSVVGHSELFAAKACPAGLDVERLIATARGLRAALGELGDP